MSRLIRNALSLVFALALLAWLLGDPRSLAALGGLLSLPWMVVAAVLVTQTISYLCRGGRLYSQFNPRIPLGFMGYLRVSLLHNLSVNVIPFRGGEVTLPLMLQRAGLPLPEAIATLVWLRVQDALVLAAMATLLWPGFSLPLRLGMLAGLVLMVWLAGKLLASGRLPLLTLLDGHAKVASLCRALTRVFDASLTSWSWCVMNWASKLLGLTVLLAALAGLPLPLAAGGALGGELSALLPVQGVAGFGTYEAGVVFLLHLGQAQWEQMFAAAFAVHCFTLALALAAGCIAWFALPAQNGLNSINRSSRTET